MSLLFVHMLSCAAMTGIIWIIQLLVYPGFQYVDHKEFLKMHLKHTSNITWVVAPLMGLELVTAAILVAKTTTPFFILNLICVLILWALTGLVSVPLHNHLAKNSKSAEHIRKLVLTNWLRTVLWSLRLLILSFFTGVIK